MRSRKYAIFYSHCEAILPLWGVEKGNRKTFLKCAKSVSFYRHVAPTGLRIAASTFIFL